MNSTIISFGKHKDKPIAAVFDRDIQYCRWLRTQKMLMDGHPDIKKYLDEMFNGSDVSSTMTWGKYKGKSLNWLLSNDRSYIDWLLSNAFVKSNCKSLYEELQLLVS